MNGLKVISTGYYAPQNVLNNFDFEKMVETTDEWIVSRTGINKRQLRHIYHRDFAIMLELLLMNIQNHYKLRLNQNTLSLDHLTPVFLLMMSY